MQIEWNWQLTPQGQWMLGGAITVVVVVATSLLVWWQKRRLRQLDARVSQLSAALALLTDTVEAGFQDVLRQGSRQPEAAVATARPRVNTQRRIKSASRRGRTVGDIAAAEQLSEGEVRLMLQMSGAQADPGRHAEMR